MAFVLFCFVFRLYAFAEAAALRSIVLRHAGVPIATCFVFFCLFGDAAFSEYFFMFLYHFRFVVVVVVVFTLKTVLTSIQYPSLSYSSRQRNEFPWSHANPK